MWCWYWKQRSSEDNFNTHYSIYISSLCSGNKILGEDWKCQCESGYYVNNQTGFCEKRIVCETGSELNTAGDACILIVCVNGYQFDNISKACKEIICEDDKKSRRSGFGGSKNY